MYEEIPEYLLPDFIKEKLKLLDDSDKKNPRKKILISAHQNENYEESLKRRLEHNNLTIEDVK